MKIKHSTMYERFVFPFMGMIGIIHVIVGILKIAGYITTSSIWINVFGVVLSAYVLIDIYCRIAIRKEDYEGE